MSSQPSARKRARREVSPLSSPSTVWKWSSPVPLRPTSGGRGKSASATLSPPSFPTRPGPLASILVTSHSTVTRNGSLSAKTLGRRSTGKKATNKCRRQVTSIDILPDDVLLVIFGFCTEEDPYVKQDIEAWQSLVHVCRRWRRVVFGSPNCLNLRLVCTAKTPAKGTLYVWPALPLLLQGIPYVEGGLDNAVAVLERSDRVREIHLERVPGSHLEKLSAVMQVPFPELTYMKLWSYGKEVVLPDSFLGGSTPRLQELHLNRVPFPGLPKLLLSAIHLVELYLLDIPHSGYISPEAMLTALPTLTCLKRLTLEFQSPRSRPDRENRLPSLPTCCVLSVLTHFQFKGDNEYLDNLVAQIDAPVLDDFYVIFFNDLIFDTKRFTQFICRTPKLKALTKANVSFDAGAATVKLRSLMSSQTTSYGKLDVEILCRKYDWQVSSLEQVCTSCLPLLFTLVDLYIHGTISSQAHWQDNLENALWLEFLHPFRAVKNLYLSKGIALLVAPALQELVGDRATEVLPTLRNIFLERQPSEPVQEGIRQFVATRESTSGPILISRWH